MATIDISNPDPVKAWILNFNASKIWDIVFLKNWQASKYFTKISAVDGYKTTEDKDIAGTLNQYFNSAVNCIGITENKSLLTGTKNFGRSSWNIIWKTWKSWSVLNKEK